MSVAELCRRLGSVPPTTDSASSGAAPVLVGDLLRREGRPLVRAEVPAARVAPSSEPEQDADQPVVPTPRSRGDACKTALGAGGLVVAGSVLGAALLAAAGVGGPLPFGQGGDDAAGQFQGEGTLVKPGTAYGSVRGRDVVARSGLLRAIAYYSPFEPASDTAVGAGTRAATGVPVAGAARPVQALPSSGAAAPVGPTTGIVTSVGGGVAHAAEPVTGPIAPVLGTVTGTTAPVLGTATETAGPILGTATGTAAPVVTDVAQAVAPAVDVLAQGASPVVDSVATVVAPLATVITPLTNDVATAVTPVADLAGTVITPVLKPMTPVVDAAAPLVNAAAPAVRPVVAATESVIQPVLAVTGPAVAPALGAAGPVLGIADPVLPSLPGRLADPVVAGDLTAAPVSVAQAATGNAVSTVRDTAAGTTSAVQGATGAVRPVLPNSGDAAEAARRIVARADAPVDPPTLPMPIVASPATGTPQHAAGVLANVVPVQATGPREPAVLDAATLPTRLLPSPDDAQARETADDLTAPRTTAQAEPPTEPLRIVAPLDDPEPSAEPRTAPLRIVGPETSEGTRADSKPAAPAPRIPAADALTDKAGGLLGR